MGWFTKKAIDENTVTPEPKAIDVLEQEKPQQTAAQELEDMWCDEDAVALSQDSRIVTIYDGEFESNCEDVYSAMLDKGYVPAGVADGYALFVVKEAMQ